MANRFRRNKYCVNNCPVCGTFVCPNYQCLGASELPAEAAAHACDPAFVARSERARDAVMAGEPEPRTSRPVGERIAEGFEMLEMGEDGIETDDEY